MGSVFKLTEAQADALVELGLCRKHLSYEQYRQLRSQILRGELYEAMTLLRKRLGRKGVNLDKQLNRWRIRKH